MAMDMIGRKKMDSAYLTYILKMDINQLKEQYLTAQKGEERIFLGYLCEQKKSFALD